jgi:hypothetical protein
VPNVIFGKSMRVKGFEQYKASAGNGWRGISLKPETTLAEAFTA